MRSQKPKKSYIDSEAESQENVFDVHFSSRTNGKENYSHINNWNYNRKVQTLIDMKVRSEQSQHNLNPNFKSISNVNK